MKLNFYISPSFLAKFYLFNAVKNISRKYAFKGSILDIGCGEKSYKNLFNKATKYIGIDFKKFSLNKEFARGKPDLYFNDDYATTLRLPFSNESFDHVVSFQVLEHHKNPKKFIDEIFRIIKKNGYILLTVPFLGGIHEAPHDYQRFTRYGLIELFKPYHCDILEIKEEGSLFSVIWMLFVEYIYNFSKTNKFCYYLSALIYTPFIIFQYFVLFFDKIFPTRGIFLNYLILIQKK